jgi:transposase
MLQPMDPDTLLLRLLTRDESRFIQDRTALVNRLRAALREYYPAALEAFEDWTVPSAWAFVERFPTPEALASVGKRAWEKFLHAHKLYRPGVQERRMEIFRRAMEFHGAAAVSSAKSLQALALIRMLRLLDAQLKEYRRRIEDAFAKHPDHDMFGSLPGLGDKIPPRLLAEIGSDRERFDTPGALQCTAGTAPVTVQSGKRRSVHMRHACNKHLRDAVHWLADVCRKACPWAQAYYEKKKVEGNSHQAALRCLGNRWLDILWKMWQTRTAYDPELHQRNQIAHGSWVFQLLPETAPETSHETP